MAAMPWLLELINLAGTGETVIGFDFEQHHQAAAAQAGRWRELFGFDPSSGTVRTFMARMLALLGFRLERTSRRSRVQCDDREHCYWHYVVVDDLKPINRREVLQHLASCHFSCK